MVNPVLPPRTPMIQFIKTLKYELRPRDIGTYEYLVKVGLQQVDPPSLAPSQLALSAKTVLHSDLRRVVECIKETSSTHLPMSELREVTFDMSLFCTRSEYARQGSNTVRRGFRKAFITDKLPIAREQLLDEIETVIDACLEHAQDGDVAVVSHSFRLKLIEAYIRTRGTLRSDPELINQFLADETKTYEFGQGFTVEPSDLREALNKENL